MLGAIFTCLLKNHGNTTFTGWVHGDRVEAQTIMSKLVVDFSHYLMLKGDFLRAAVIERWAGNYMLYMRRWCICILKHGQRNVAVMPG